MKNSDEQKTTPWITEWINTPIMNSKKAHIVDKDAWMECGACARNCPAEAIQVQAGVGCAAAVITGSINNVWWAMPPFGGGSNIILRYGNNS